MDWKPALIKHLGHLAPVGFPQMKLAATLGLKRRERAHTCTQSRHGWAHDPLLFSLHLRMADVSMSSVFKGRICTPRVSVAHSDVLIVIYWARTQLTEGGIWWKTHIHTHMFLGDMLRFASIVCACHCGHGMCAWAKWNMRFQTKQPLNVCQESFSDSFT